MAIGNEKVNKVLHKSSSWFAVAAVVATSIPALLPYQALFAGLAALFGGVGIAQDVASLTKFKQ